MEPEIPVPGPYAPKLQPPLSRADSISRHGRCTQAPQQPFDLIHIYRSSQLADTGKPLFCPWLFAVAQSILIASIGIIKWVATCVRTAVISLNEPEVTWHILDERSNSSRQAHDCRRADMPWNHHPDKNPEDRDLLWNLVQIQLTRSRLAPQWANAALSCLLQEKTNKMSIKNYLFARGF